MRCYDIQIVNEHICATDPSQKVLDSWVRIIKDAAEALNPSHNIARDEILCDYPNGCGSRSNGRCDLAEKCDNYIPHKTSPVA